MKKKKNTIAKIMAFLALFWIIIWVVWTWALFMFTSNNNSSELTQEEYIELQNYINSLSGSTEKEDTSTWILTWTWVATN